MAKQPTPQGISALLKRAGFDRSMSKSSRIRGFSEFTEGFKVSKDYDGGVLVEWLPNSFRARGNNEERERDMLGKYRKTIEEAGYAVADGSTALTAKLLVTAKEARPWLCRLSNRCAATHAGNSGTSSTGCAPTGSPAPALPTRRLRHGLMPARTSPRRRTH